MIRIILPLVSIALITVIELNAQTYCVPPPFITGPFTGILKVEIGDWEHSSSFEDGFMYFDDVAPAQVEIGMSYEASVKCEHTLAGAGFSGNLNYRIWIDWNQDGDFEDTDEDVLSANEKYYTTTQTATFDVPEDALTGITRMRVYNDMPYSEGHDNPTPCGYLESTNPLGHHGEVEDYDIEVLQAPEDTNQDWPVGIHGEINGVSWSVISTPGRQVIINTSSLAEPFQISAINLLGQEVYASPLYLPGKLQASLDLTNQQTGIYFIRLQSGDSSDTKKILIH